MDSKGRDIEGPVMMNCTCHKKLCGEYLSNGKCLIYQCYEVLIREMIREKEHAVYPIDHCSIKIGSNDKFK